MENMESICFVPLCVLCVLCVFKKKNKKMCFSTKVFVIKGVYIVESRK